MLPKRNCPNLSFTPMTSKFLSPILILLPTPDSRGNNFAATSEPSTQTGRPPSTSASEKKRPSLTVSCRTSALCSLLPVTQTEPALLSFDLTGQLPEASTDTASTCLDSVAMVRASVISKSRRFLIFHH